MINFWDIQRSFLIIRSVSSGWKYNFSGKRGAVNVQQLVVMDAVRQSTRIPVNRARLPLCGTQAELGNEELQPSPVSRPLECQRVDVTLHTGPQAGGGYQGDNLAEPQHSECLRATCGGISASQPWVETPGNSSSYWGSVFCALIPVQGLWGEGRIHQHVHWQTHAPVLFMKSYELKSICRSGVLWVPRENPLTVVPASSQQFIKKIERKRGGGKYHPYLFGLKRSVGMKL